MGKSNQVNTGTINFYERYAGHTDSQILEILKNQKSYQENAKNAAVKIAIERKLIHSELDLLSPGFQNNKNTSLSLFPQMESDYHHQRLVGSVFRFLYVLTFLPLAYGFLKYAEGYIDQTILGVCIGLTWLLLIILLKRTEKSFIFVPLFGILIFIGAKVGFKIMDKLPIRFLDLVILIIGMLLTVYFLILAKKLIQNKPKTQE